MTEEGVEPHATLGPLARARLDDLLAELLARVGDVMDAQDRLRGLLDAVVGIAGDLDLDKAQRRRTREDRGAATWARHPGGDHRLAGAAAPRSSR